MPSWLAQGTVVKSYNLTRLAGMLRGRWLNVFFNNLTRLAGMLRGQRLDILFSRKGRILFVEIRGRLFGKLLSFGTRGDTVWRWDRGG